MMRSNSMNCRILLGIICSAIAPALLAQPAGGIAYEKVLLPSVVNVPLPGSFGSRWVTRLIVTNPTNHDIDEYYARLYATEGHQAVEPMSTPLPANSTVEVSTIQDDPSVGSRGIFYFIDRRFIDQVQISLRVQDLSRQSQTWGTALPVVRERQFVNRTVTLNDVRVDASSRMALRIYSLDTTQPSKVKVSIYGFRAGLLANTPPDVLLGSGEFDLRRFTPIGPGADNPAPNFFELSQLDAIAPVSGDDRVRVDITPLDASRIWAFASITNNETQHVTIIAPSP
jgi:hypothetical protein